MTSRSPAVDALLARVREAVRAQPVSVASVPSHAMVRRVAREQSDLASLFATKASAIGMRVTRISDAELDATIAKLLENRGKTVVAVCDQALAARAATAAGARLAPNDNDDLLFDCEVGITDVDCAIAESGSLVVSTNGRIRNAWITPPIHIAIVRAGEIVADLVDLFESRPDALDAASTTIITGPSKTADIEGVLVTGVHGPAAVEIVLVG
ncbi:MAG: Lactate utilization protein [Planctomycetota bacterium]|jgi:L-lactate dehydrogenase complex protein LldG